MFAPLLDRLADTGVDLAQVVIIADALHVQRAQTQHLHQRGAGFVLTVKQNQPALFAALGALPWAQVPIAARDIDTGHGRITHRNNPLCKPKHGPPFKILISLHDLGMTVAAVWSSANAREHGVGSWRYRSELVSKIAAPSGLLFHDRHALRQFVVEMKKLFIWSHCVPATYSDVNFEVFVASFRRFGGRS
ncbi:MAG: hypothetical protein M3Y48_14955 [Actinomycetota bacterium]|nr:hypothetical protein [Actinomycetota bacterium]